MVASTSTNTSCDLHLLFGFWIPFEKLWVSVIAILKTLTWEMIFSADSVESLSPMPSSLQPSPASSLHTAHVANSALPKDDPNTSTVSTEENRSESEFLFLPDYLILSNCETGRLHHTRYAYFWDSVGSSRIFYSVHRAHWLLQSLYLRCAQRT